MATAVLVVEMKVPKDVEVAFNRFYDEVHIPDVLAFPGAVSFRRYRAFMGEDHYESLVRHRVQGPGDAPALPGF